MVYLGQSPPAGKLKLVDFGQLALAIDCNGREHACGYCEAQKYFKSLGMSVVEKGKEYGRDYEIWAEPREISIN